MITVLLVENDFVLRDVLEEVLIDCGYDVLAVPNAESATNVLQSPNRISVLLTDVNLGGTMDGAQLANWVMQYRPGIVTLIMSGGRESRARVDAVCKGARFFAKPFLVTEISDYIRSSVSGQEER